MALIETNFMQMDMVRLVTSDSFEDVVVEGMQSDCEVV